MTTEPSFETIRFNPFLANDFLNDSNQNPDVTFIMIFLFLKLATYHQAKLIKTSGISLKNNFLSFN